jgi:hypothetical protein
MPILTSRSRALGENAQRDGLASAGGPGDEGEAAFAVCTQAAFVPRVNVLITLFTLLESGLRAG